MVVWYIPEGDSLEAYDCLMTGWTNVLIVYCCLIARCRRGKISC